MLPLLCKVAPQTTDLYRCAQRALPFYELGCALFVLPPAPPTAGLQRSAHHAIPFYVLGREPSVLPLLCKDTALQPAQRKLHVPVPAAFGSRAGRRGPTVSDPHLRTAHTSTPTAVRASVRPWTDRLPDRPTVNYGFIAASSASCHLSKLVLVLGSTESAVPGVTLR